MNYYFFPEDYPGDPDDEDDDFIPFWEDDIIAGDVGKPPLDEDQCIQITAQIMTDETPLTVEIDIKRAWLLISGIQLATRHPGLSDLMTATLGDIARRFASAIVSLHPEAEKLIDMGWNPQFDRSDDMDIGDIPY